MFKGIDLFSDTVTCPTAAMRQAIMAAEVGDEQKGEDPTTLCLEARMAEMLGHSAALFFPSATMANEVAIRTLCEPGDELIAAEHCHLFVAEAGGPAVHSGVLAHPIHTSNGIFSAADIHACYRWPRGPHYPVGKLLSIENTTNIEGGVPWLKEELDEVLHAAQTLDLRTHLDGSRLFNAAIATGLSVTTIASPFDTVTVCFSKGLGCPAGAILAFNERYYAKVRRLKQLMGGSMRQSGMLAAAALYALEHHVNRLADDHAHAAYLAARLAEIPYIQVEPNSRRTNMVFFAWDSPTVSCEIFWAACKAKGVRFSQVGKNRLRAVTHLDIQHSDIEQAVTIIKEIVNAL